MGSGPQASIRVFDWIPLVNVRRTGLVKKTRSWGMDRLLLVSLADLRHGRGVSSVQQTASFGGVSIASGSTSPGCPL